MFIRISMRLSGAAARTGMENEKYIKNNIEWDIKDYLKKIGNTRENASKSIV